MLEITWSIVNESPSINYAWSDQALFPAAEAGVLRKQIWLKSIIA